jgi:hypothetical protein
VTLGTYVYVYVYVYVCICICICIRICLCIRICWIVERRGMKTMINLEMETEVEIEIQVEVKLRLRLKWNFISHRWRSLIHDSLSWMKLNLSAFPSKRGCSIICQYEEDKRIKTIKMIFQEWINLVLSCFVLFYFILFCFVLFHMILFYQSILNQKIKRRRSKEGDQRMEQIKQWWMKWTHNTIAV